ncbi:MAG: fibronectin type III domain-containing protein [Bacilli bacterium]|nr:fibronectin type III domain-containing protein [Bacilli bacterium]
MENKKVKLALALGLATLCMTIINPVKAVTYDDLVKDGVFNVNAIKPTTEDEFWQFYEDMEYENNGEYLLENCNKDYSQCELSILNKGTQEYKNYKVKVKYAKSDAKIVDKVNKAIKKIEKLKSITLDDVNVVQYYHGTLSLSQYIKTLADPDLEYIYNGKLGTIEPFKPMSSGLLHIKYKGIYYDTVLLFKSAGYPEKNMYVIDDCTIYIPQNTKNTPEAFISAAKKKIKAVLGKNFTINVNKKINETIDLQGLNLDKNIYGEYTYLITFKDGEEPIDFLIAKDSKKGNLTLTSDSISGFKEEMDYTGKEIKQKVKVTYLGKKLIEGTDYTITYKNNKNVGTSTIIIKGNGIFNGTIKKTFKITAKKISKSNITVSDKTYNAGKAVNGKVVIKDGDKTLKLNKDYTIKYKNNKNIGQASVIIKGMGNYKGSVTKKFYVIPKTTSISKLTTISKGFIIKWKRYTIETTGYQLEYSLDKKFKTSTKVLIKNNQTNTKTISKLKSNKKYYVRIRTYKVVNGKKIYSAWSKIKSIKTK